MSLSRLLSEGGERVLFSWTPGRRCLIGGAVGVYWLIRK